MTDNRHLDRVDFIKRFFAVAISVGFASTIARMAWLTEARLPQGVEWDQICVLFVGLVATVLSWDGYLKSVESKPLISEPRYFIDIALVFLYMTLLLTSSHSELWLLILVVIFALYVFWDLLAVREHMNKYCEALAKDRNGTAPLSDVIRVYFRGVRNDPATQRGPVISLTWFLFFVGLWVSDKIKFEHEVPVMAFFAFVGLRCYRFDKGKTLSGAAVRGITMGNRVALVGGLLVTAVIVATWGAILFPPA